MADGLAKVRTTGAPKKAVTERGGILEAFRAGKGRAFSEGAEASLLQQAVEACCLWHAKFIAWQHAEPSSFVAAPMAAQFNAGASSEKSSDSATLRIKLCFMNRLQ